MYAHPHHSKRNLGILTLFFLLSNMAIAAPVDRKTANTVATNFLSTKGIMSISDTLSLYPVKDYDGCFYIFNLYDEGFVIVSADDRCTPVLGYSVNGSFDYSRCPSNMLGWLDGYARDIRAGIKARAPEDPEALAQWKQLLNPSPDQNEPKSDQYLITSTWEQGSGYNNYCPVMNGSHVVVGCVATAMAQIIRYYGFPTRGFGKKSYIHSTYGILAVDFDTTEYDYSLMPDRIHRNSSAQEKDMVSRLCYHCGITVDMNYQNASHTSGSGTQTSLVPAALMHFGYTDAVYMNRNSFGDDVEWKRIIRSEIDNGRPIEYAGFGSDGGHAFILDGYTSGSRFHFNWGWGGYADGFYSLTTMQGFTSDQDMVINIKPSGWDGHLTRFYVSPDGDGNGTSWEQANSNLAAAVKLNRVSRRDIWMKEGIYYGDTTAEYAYTLTDAANVYGGFAGDETSFNQRDPKAHPTILDGMNRRAVLWAAGGGSDSKTIILHGLTLRNGYSPKGHVVELRNSFSARDLVVSNCASDSGDILYLYNGLARSIHIENNSAPVVCAMNDAIIRQSLINNNVGTATSLSYSRIVNTDIVSNSGLAVLMKNPQSSLVNTIIWNNDSCLRHTDELRDTSVRHCAFDCDSALIDSTCLLLSPDNDAPDGPQFILPCTQRGIADCADADWHLRRGSVCIDGGERLTESIKDGDMDQKIRCRNGKIDLGCYETNYPVSISEAAAGQPLLSPNPATTHVTLSGINAAEVQIRDITGRTVMHCPTTPGQTTLDLTVLPAGVYFLHAGGHTAKLIKQ